MPIFNCSKSRHFRCLETKKTLCVNLIKWSILQKSWLGESFRKKTHISSNLYVVIIVELLANITEAGGPKVNMFWDPLFETHEVLNLQAI